MWKLAALTGIAPDTIRRYEAVESGPSLGNALTLADALGVTLEALTGDATEAAS